MGLYNRLELDKNTVENGMWVEFAEKEGDTPAVLVKVRAFRSAKARRVRNEQTQKNLSRTMTAKLEQETMTELLTAAIIVDWKGVTDRDGVELPFTEANVRQVLQDLPVFAEQIMVAANQDETFRKAAIERIVGNSESTSAGT